MTDRNSKFDVTHPFTPNPRQGDLDATTITNHSLELDSFVLPAGTLVVLGRSKNTFTEQSALFRFESPVVDRLGVFGLPAAPGKNRFRRSNGNANFVEAYASFHAEDFTSGLGLLVHGMFFSMWIGVRQSRLECPVFADLRP